MSFLATKEAVVRPLNVGISRTGVEEGITEFSVEGFAIKLTYPFKISKWKKINMRYP